jgi:hypothetical protein
MNRMLCVGLLAFTAGAQEPVAAPPASAPSLQGIVRQKGENNPVWGATVELRKEGSNAALYGALTGADGKWAFPKVPVGRYRLISTCPGYVTAEYGQKRMNGQGLPIILSDGQQMSDVRIEMVPTGAISGRITDPSGQPIVFADVFALKSSYQEGERLLTPVLSAKTDDRGDFRIFWITPATYYLAVIATDVIRPTTPLIMNADGRDTLGTTPLIRTIPREVLSASNAGRSETYPPIYFANTNDVRQAQYIDVAPGSDIKGVDITVAPTHTFEVSGIVTNSVTGQFPGSPATMLAILPFDPFGAPNGNFVNAQTGKFQMKSVVPGRYMLYAAPTSGRGVDDPDAIWGGMEVEVRDQNIDNLNIVAKHGVVLSGKVIVEDQPDSVGVASASGLYIAIRPQPLIGTRAPSTITKVSPDGSFSLPGIIEGKYRAYVLPLLNPANPDLLNGVPDFQFAKVDLSLAPSGLQNAYVKSIRVGGTDVLDGGFRLTPNLSMEIVIGRNSSTINGRVLRIEDGKQVPAIDITVGAVPDSNAARGFRTDMHRATQTDASGLFQLRGLPPGDYRVFAWEEADKDAIMDLDFVRINEDKGTRVHVDEGDRQNIELDMIPAIR